MVKLELYIREITRFLRTVTIKNVYFVDQMNEVWVNPKYRDVLSVNDYPYYRHLSGNYILSNATFEKAREKLGIPTEKRCTVVHRILSNTDAYLQSEVQSAEKELYYCRTLLQNPSLNPRYMNDEIIKFMDEEYGLVKTVLVNGTYLPTDVVYTKFDNVPITRSFDTREKIPFTYKVINSRSHRKTKATYKIPSSYYDKITEEYSNEREIIKNILYPISSIEDAIAAENYSVLACDLTQLEENERTTLYSAMLDKLNVIRRRWDVSQFTYENMYAVSMQAKIWSVLIAELFKQRILNIRTSEVHSFHLWNYLESHGIGDFSDIITRKQALFLYKNWPWLYRNRGSDHNIILLTHKLLFDNHLTTHDKVVLQQNETLRTDCRSTPVAKTGEIQQEILERLRLIEKNDDNYLNKTIKAEDELNSFQYTRPDGEQIALNDTEEIEVTFDKERTAKLEYQDDVPFTIATALQKTDFAYTPHTNFPTKLLELRKRDIDDILAKMYIRFVTESILYNVAMGYGEDVLKLEYGEISATLSVKDLLILFLYCEGQLHGYFSRIVNGQLHKPKIPRHVYLCVPYKKEFEDMTNERGYYTWHNFKQYYPHIFNIIPETLQLSSNDVAFPDIFLGEYSLRNRDASVINWIWENDKGSTLQYDVTGKWVLSGVDGTLLYNHTVVPYWNWLCWHPKFNIVDPSNFWSVDAKELDKDFSVLSSTEIELKVTRFHYRVEDWMPNYDTALYYSDTDKNVSLVHLIDKQATYYIEMYKEYISSGWSRQHAGCCELIDSRTFKGIVDLNLSSYETFEEHIRNSYELNEIVQSFDEMASDIRTTELKYLADTIVKLLYPIESDYLIDSNLSMINTFNRIKDLIVNLCSYNVAWVTDGDRDAIINIDCIGHTTLDIAHMNCGFDTNMRLTDIDTNITVVSGFHEKWCYDEIIRYHYVRDEEGHIHIVDAPACHDCVDHQFIITSNMDGDDGFYNPTPFSVDDTTSDVETAYGLHLVLNLPDMDYLREMHVPASVAEMRAQMQHRLDSFNPKELSTDTYNSIIGQMLKSYHIPFAEYALASYLDDYPDNFTYTHNSSRLTTTLQNTITPAK